MWKIKKIKIGEFWKKKIEKIDFFGNSIFSIFWIAKKPKNRIIKNVKIWSNDAKFLSRHSKEGC